MPINDNAAVHIAHGTLLVRGTVNSRGEASTDYPWLVTWLPTSRSDPGFPGFTLSSTDGQVPQGPTINDVVKWAERQPWATRGAIPEVAENLEVPADEWAELQAKAFEHHVRFGFTMEPDGRYSWGLFSNDDVLLQSGMADTWDDARLAMIENLYPPSGEQ